MIAKWIGRRAADVVAFLRDKPFIPSDIDTTPSSVKFWNNPRYFNGGIHYDEAYEQVAWDRDGDKWVYAPGIDWYCVTNKDKHALNHHLDPHPETECCADCENGCWA